MIVSFFKDKTYITGADYSYKSAVPHKDAVIDEEMGIILEEEVLAQPESGSTDCVLVQDVDFDPNTQELYLEGGEVNIYAKVPPPENPDERKTRILSGITLENIDETDIDFQVSDIEIGDLIVKLVFNNNPHAQNALQARVIEMILSGEQYLELIDTIKETQSKINKVRSKFKLSPL